MNYNPMIDYQRNQLLAQQALIQNQDAKKYHQMYLDSGDETYKNMAKDELGHAIMTLIRKANLKMPAAEEKMKLRQYEDEYKKMSEQM